MQLPAGARIWQATGGPKAWKSDDWFNSKIFHALNIANWQRTENGRKGTNAPKEPKPPEYTLMRERRELRMDRKAQRFIERQAQMKAITGKAERDEPVARPDDT